MMTSSDYGRIGFMVKPQYQYLQNFAEQVNAGTVASDVALNRAEMYAEWTRVMHDHGQQRAWGVDLPTFPKDGTDCGPACKCSWSLSQTKDEIRAYWRTNSTQSCGTCADRAAEYSPLVFTKEE